jgi:hypothetical protein
MTGVVFAIVTLAALTMAGPRPSVAETYRPWCADYGGSTNCGFHTYEQCKMTASGTNTFCVHNPWYDGPSHAGSRRR